MAKITVRTAGSKVKIRLQEEAKAPVAQSATGAESVKLSGTEAAIESELLLSTRVINLMEIRAESSFRPNEEDVELVYALSGSEPNTPDTLHKLSSRKVVEDATQAYVISSVQGAIEHITKERDGKPGLIILLHTHPRSTPQPSEDDKRYFRSTSQTIHAMIPRANILFGVHAISSESIRERHEPIKVSKNTIKWGSITREHEVAFYAPDAKPYEVNIIG
jgi:proteasome lid subunit RPN8/RPN11